MKTSAILTAFAAAAYAAPLEARDGPHGADASPFAGLAGLLGGGGGGFDFAKIGGMLTGGAGGMDMGKLAGLVSPEMMTSIGPLMTMFLQTAKINKIVELKPRFRPEAKRVKIIYGPYKLKGTETKQKLGNGFSFDPAGTGYMYQLADDFPRDITILDVSSGVTDENYAPIDIGKGLYNHHNVFYDVSSKPLSMTACASGKSSFVMPMNIFMGGATESTGQPYTSTDGQFNSGFYLGKDAKIITMIDVVNYKPQDQNVYVVSEMEYLPGKVAESLPASVQVIDIGMCDGKTGLFVHPPEGQKQWTINGSDISITENGYLLSSKAHLHDGAVNMEIYLNGKEVCNSKAVYGGEGREGVAVDGSKWEGLAGTTICPSVISVKKGDTMKFIANFDVALHPEREQEKGSMGGMGMGGMGMGGGESPEGAEGMALFTAAFAHKLPGTNAKYNI